MADTGIEFVLDASALLAFLRGEPGADEVQLALDRSTLSTVNWSEVVRVCVSHGVSLDGLRDDVEALGVQLMWFSVDDAEAAAAVWPQVKRLGLSLSDRACLALAGRLAVPAVTADRAWSTADLAVAVRVIR